MGHLCKMLGVRVSLSHSSSPLSIVSFLRSISWSNLSANKYIFNYLVMRSDKTDERLFMLAHKKKNSFS